MGYLDQFRVESRFGRDFVVFKSFLDSGDSTETPCNYSRLHVFVTFCHAIICESMYLLRAQTRIHSSQSIPEPSRE